MPQPIAPWRVTYVPGTWVALSGPSVLAILQPAPPRVAGLLNRFWDAILRTASIQEVSAVLVEHDLAQLSSFGLFFWDADGLHVLTKGQVRVTDAATNDVLATGEGVVTWTETNLGPNAALRVALEPLPAQEMLSLPLVAGGALVSSLVLTTAPDSLAVTDQVGLFGIVPAEDVQPGVPEHAAAELADPELPEHALVPEPEDAGEPEVAEGAEAAEDSDLAGLEPEQGEAVEPEHSDAAAGEPEEPQDGDQVEEAQPSPQVIEALPGDVFEPELVAEAAVIAVPEPVVEAAPVIAEDSFTGPLDPNAPLFNKAEPVAESLVPPPPMAAAPVASATPPPPPAPVNDQGGLVSAVVCNQGHPNPVGAQTCRVCRGQVGDIPRLVPKPKLAVIRSSFGTSVDLNGPVIIGRAPDTKGEAGVGVLKVPSPNTDISRSHLRVQPAGWQVQVEDLHSTNGSLLAIPGQQPFRLTPGVPTDVPIGSIVDLGDGIQIRIDAGE